MCVLGKGKFKLNKTCHNGLTRVKALINTTICTIRREGVMENMINSTVNGIDKLLTVVNSGRKLFFLTCLVSLTGFSYLTYELIKDKAIIDSIVAPKIERVGGRWCYQRKRGGITQSRVIGIQFPLSKELESLGVEQNMTGFIVTKEPSYAEFNHLCDQLVKEVLSPERQDFLLRQYPESKQKLLDYFRRLETMEKQTATANKIEQS